MIEEWRPVSDMPTGAGADHQPPASQTPQRGLSERTMRKEAFLIQPLPSDTGQTSEPLAESSQEKPMCKCKWQSIETAPKDSGYLLLRGGREQDVASGYWLQAAYAGNGAWIWPFVHMTPRFWAHLPPTSAEGVEHG